MRPSLAWQGWPLIAGALALVLMGVVLAGAAAAPSGLHVAAAIGLALLAVALALRLVRVADEQRRALAEAERLRRVSDELPSLVAYLDGRGHYRYANAQYGRLFGVDPRAVLGLSIEELLGAATWRDVQPHLRAALAGERQRFEREQRLNGESLCLQVEYIPDRAADGSVRGVVALAVDVTPLTRAERAARQDRERLQQLADNLPALVAHIDTDERYTFANAQFALIGLAPEQMIGRTARETRPEFYDEVLRPHLQSALAGHRSSVEGHTVRNGRGWHYRIDYVPDRDAAGRVRGCFSLTVDLTAMREAELARARAEERMRRVTDNLPALISYIDTDERLQFANATYREWLGKDPAGLIGLTMREVLGETLYSNRQPYLRRALAGERVEFESDGSAAGVTRITQTTYIPDVDAGGTVRGLYAFNADVTRLKTAENRLQALARSDTLTGLPNRLHFDERIKAALARAAQQGGGVALMFLDIDHFKQINDQLGHAAGDAVLVEFARRLRTAVRPTDLVARLAGDEFVVLLEGLHSDAEPQFVARKLLAQFQRPIEAGAAAPVDVTTSVGIAYHDGASAATAPAVLLARADAALYSAKHAGRNTFRVA